MFISNELESDNMSEIDSMKNQITNLKELESSCATASLQLDAIAITTQFTKQFFFYLNDCYDNFTKSNFYKILFRTTQPAHLISVLSVLTIAFILHPNNLEQNNEVPSKLLSFIYLGCFATYIGSQIWMTFVSGLSLYFSLPRHHFSEVQRVLFPKYFTLNSILCLIILTIFAQHHNAFRSEPHIIFEIINLTIAFLVNITIRLYLSPVLLKLNAIKIKIEARAGVGMEIGTQDLGPLTNCPHYMQIHKSFRKVHMSIAFGNISTMTCSVLHLYYLSSKLCVL